VDAQKDPVSSGFNEVPVEKTVVKIVGVIVEAYILINIFQRPVRESGGV
jgi:hypothetical protein